MRIGCYRALPLGRGRRRRGTFKYPVDAISEYAWCEGLRCSSRDGSELALVHFRVGWLVRLIRVRGTGMS